MTTQIQETLESIGFTFHHGDEVPEDAALAGKHWWCWCGPFGEWDIEAGAPCDAPESAINEAVAMLASYAVDAEGELCERRSIAGALL